MAAAASSSATAIPQILTRSAVPQLSQGLDAGDILECYALVRKAPMHNGMLPDATITVHKVALGLRYRPLKVNDLEEEAKIREITLEYGPQRMGVSLTQESMPLVHKEQVSGMDDTSNINNHNNSNNTDDSTKSFLTWENEGKIYYTTQIASTRYISAYYMASVTGAVLRKVLEKAVEYPLENAFVRGRPRRYQPFVVVDASSTDQMPPPGFEGEIPEGDNTPRVMIRSSSDADFMEYMWYTLAELGVSIHPILAPPIYQVQLFATGVEKVKVGPPTWVTQSAATFYSKLYRCIEAKVTGDYSKYAKPTAPPITQEAPSQAPVPVEPIIVDSNSSTSGTQGGDTDEHDGDSMDDGGGARKRTLTADIPTVPSPPIDALAIIEGDLHDENNTAVNNQNIVALTTTTSQPVSLPILGPTNSPGDNSGTANSGGAESLRNNSASIQSFDTDNHTLSPTSSLAQTIVPSSAPTIHKTNPKDTKNEVDEAQEAADEAKQAAAEAKDAAKTEVDSKAANAAEAAANAAQKAADATSNAAALAAMEALFNGDGSAIATILSPCLSDPLFGIAKPDENGTLVSQAYLYLDGSSYYKLNLSFPFMQVVSVEHTLPQPRDFGGSGGGVDFVDWSLALLLLFVTVFGILMLIQHVFGGYVKLVRPLFDFQVWFFNPLHYEDIKTTMEVEQNITQSQQHGMGHVHTFGQDAIPFSMGGRRPFVPMSPVRANKEIRRKNSRVDDDDDDDVELRERIPLTGSGEHQDESESSHKMCEIEMTEAKTPPINREFGRGTSRGSAGSADSASSFGFVENVGATNGIVGNMELVVNDHCIMEKGLRSRLARDPDLVDMPNLKSTSKVAIPVGINRNRSFTSVSGSTL